MTRVLVVGGLDPCGGAGITADARTLLLHGAEALPIAAALTVQNRRGMTAIDEVPEVRWRAALAAAAADGPIDAVKVGLLASAAQVEAVAGALRAFAAARVPVVVDPVLSATAGGYDAVPAVARAYRRALVPLARAFTPNAPELAAVLAGDDVAALLREGCGAVLAKGGHGGGAMLVDRLHTATGEREFVHPALAVGAVHGTGCALASALAARLANGEDVAAAAAGAIAFVQLRLAALGPPPADGLPRPLPLQHAITGIPGIPAITNTSRR